MSSPARDITPVLARRIAIALLAALALSLALHATPALAARTYDSHITGLREPVAVTVDASDHLWAYDRGGAAEYSSYPSQTKIGPAHPEQSQVCGGGCVSGFTVDSANEHLYIASCCGYVYEFGPTGRYVPPPWSTPGSGNFGNFIVADNSGGPKNGTLYKAGEETRGIFAYQPNREPLDFSASEPYISGNEITGPQSGVPFGYQGLTLALDSAGDIYVSEQQHEKLYEFRPNGELVQEIPGVFGELAVDPVLGDILVATSPTRIVELSPTGEFLGEITEANGRPFGDISGIAFDSEGHLFVSDASFNLVDVFTPKVLVPKVTYEEVSPTSPTSGTLSASVDPNGGGAVTTCEFEYGTDATFNLGSLPCSPAAPYPGSQAQAVHATISGLATNTTYYYRVVVANAGATRSGRTQTYVPRWVQRLRTEPASNVENTSARLNGSFVGNEEDTHYYFEYGTDASYGSKIPTSSPGEDAGAGEPLVRLHVPPLAIGELQPGVTYHYRIVASNEGGTTYGQDETFTTLTKPSIEAFSSLNVAATSAELHTTINPQGGDTHYYFEYGADTEYGGYAPSAPPGEDIGSSQEPQRLQAHLTGLQDGITYHFRVIAENPYGRSVSEDQTFSFHPPNCPNAHLRQITGASYLPDCRAYELVSPGYAGGTSLYPEGPSSPQATDPSRFTYGGILGAIPGAGDPPNSLGDLYVATRTDQGWTSEYVGPPGNQALVAGGPPDEPGSSEGNLVNILTEQAGVRADVSLSSFLAWNEGNRGLADEEGETPYDYTPTLWSSDGESLGTWPTAPGYESGPVFEQSADFSHFVFQTGEAPNLSIIDNDTETGSATVVSLKPGGGAISLEPGDTEPNYESLRIPAVSEDGSHILMSVRGETEELCGSEERRLECELAPGHLYMRVDDHLTYDVSEGRIVSYVGMTPDGSKVYFTSSEKLTPEDKDSSADLYMWSEEKAEESKPALTLISKGDNAGNPGEPGQSDACAVKWTTQCGVLPYENNGHNQIFAYGSFLGNGLSDNSIAAENGDVYFFSPEQLVGGKGLVGQENMYDFRGGRVQYVTTLSSKGFCVEHPSSPFISEFCSVGPVARMQVTPSDSRMAFLTASKVTAYENAEHLEMYIYDPASEELRCVSCRPDGEPPTSDVEASSDGIFMAEDGRVFFSTADPLVPQDTDGLRDVYEYVEGHAQLISSGTSSNDSNSGVLLGINGELFTAGLVGVSENGVDAYFSTYDTLVGQDSNGNQLKFYDARTNGGFPYVPPAKPCESADECHGAGAAAPQAVDAHSAAALGGGGNLPPRKAKCRPGSVRRHGKCVPRHHRRNKKHPNGRAGRGRRVR